MTPFQIRHRIMWANPISTKVDPTQHLALFDPTLDQTRVIASKNLRDATHKSAEKYRSP